MTPVRLGFVECDVPPYARQGMEGDRAGLHRTPAPNRLKLRD